MVKFFIERKFDSIQLEFSWYTYWYKKKFIEDSFRKVEKCFYFLYGLDFRQDSQFVKFKAVLSISVQIWSEVGFYIKLNAKRTQGDSKYLIKKIIFF